VVRDSACHRRTEPPSTQGPGSRALPLASPEGRFQKIVPKVTGIA
jgi:hypothetical protein